MADDQSYARSMWKIFSEDLFVVFIKLGFELVERPYYDKALAGFRATYVRRYVLHNQTVDGSMMTIIHLVGLPFGNHSQKMVILASPRNIDNEPVCNTLKLRIYIDSEGHYHVVHGEHSTNINVNKNHSFNQNQMLLRNESSNTIVNKYDTKTTSSSEQMGLSMQDHPSFNWHEDTIQNKTSIELIRDLINFITHIIELISPGLIELPIDVKLEILKRLNVASIIRMSQVNSEFRSLIFQHGESLWRHLCLRDFNINIINRRRHGTWLELYKEAYLIQQIEICRKERALPGLPDRPALPPVPDRLQIGWLPEVLQEAPFLPIEAHNVIEHIENGGYPFAIQPMRRAESLDSLLHE